MNDRVVKDIALIASLLDGKVKFNKIVWSEILPCKQGESMYVVCEESQNVFKIE